MIDLAYLPPFPVYDINFQFHQQLDIIAGKGARKIKYK